MHILICKDGASEFFPFTRDQEVKGYWLGQFNDQTEKEINVGERTFYYAYSSVDEVKKVTSSKPLYQLVQSYLQIKAKILHSPGVQSSFPTFLDWVRFSPRVNTTRYTGLMREKDTNDLYFIELNGRGDAITTLINKPTIIYGDVVRTLDDSIEEAISHLRKKISDFEKLPADLQKLGFMMSLGNTDYRISELFTRIHKLSER